MKIISANNYALILKKENGKMSNRQAQNLKAFRLDFIPQSHYSLASLPHWTLSPDLHSADHVLPTQLSDHYAVVDSATAVYRTPARPLARAALLAGSHMALMARL